MKVSRDMAVLKADQQEVQTLKHLDASETAFFARQLEYVKSRTYDKKYKNLRAQEFIPVSMEVPAGADTYIWYSYGKTGVAKIISDYATDFPRVDIYAEEQTAKVYSIGDSYAYSIKEIRRAALAKVDLDTRRANTARRAIDEKIDDMAWNGDSARNVPGFINYPGITEYTLPNGAGGQKTWASKTADEINLDLIGLMNAVSVPTKGKEMVDTIILPRTQFNLMKNLRMGSSSDKTLYKFFTENNPDVMIEAVDELTGTGAGGTDRIMAYVRDEDHLVQEMPSPFEQLEPDKQGASWVVPCMAEYGGVNVMYPQSVAYADGL